MNETNIIEAIITLSNYWVLCIPFIISGAIIIGGILSIIVNSVYSYVNRSEEALFDHTMFFVKLMYRKQELKRNRIGKMWIDRGSNMPYWIGGDGGHISSEELWVGLFFNTLIWLGYAGVLHLLPTSVIFVCLALYGTLWTARLATDGVKRASVIAEALNAHKEDKDAHKGVK